MGEVCVAIDSDKHIATSRLGYKNALPLLDACSDKVQFRKGITPVSFNLTSVS